MNFLQLCQRTRQEADFAGSGPTTVVGQTGELGNLVNWVADAWREIQGVEHWDWQWEEGTLIIPNGASKLATTISHDRWVKDAGYLGTRKIDHFNWDRFRLLFPKHLFQPGPPEAITAWSVAPDKTFRVNVTVDADTTIAFERYASPTELVADTDTPTMDSEFHMAIVWWALVKNHNFNEAGVSRLTAQEELNKVWRGLEKRLTPEMSLGQPLM